MTTTIEITTYRLTLEDLRQIAEGLTRRLRFWQDETTWLSTDDLLEMLTEAVQEIKTTPTEVTP